MIKEACVENYSQALRAYQQGSSRIELCENLAVGGTTPSYGTIKACLENLPIPTLVMIRPRGGDFVYSSAEIAIMQEDIAMCKELGVVGVVLGVLTPDNQIDYLLLKELITLANPMQITFHKAIDELANPIAEVKKLASLGVARILSSGGATTALAGKTVLNAMVAEASNNSISIVIAGSVRDDNLAEVASQIKSDQFHGKLIVGNLVE